MDIRKIAVLGAGRLGRGIAECAASKGYEVVLFSRRGGQDALRRIEKSLDRNRLSGVSPNLKRGWSLGASAIPLI